MRKWIGFLAGATFALAAIITCGKGGGGSTTDANSGTGPGVLDALVPNGVGDARAQATAGTKWAHAHLDLSSVSGGPIPVFRGPAGADIDFTRCSGLTEDSESSFVCCSNILGAQGWELVALTDDYSGYFKKALP